MRKNLIILITALFIGLGAWAQKVVDKLSDVKNPKQGKLYYSKEENKLTIYEAGKFQLVFTAEKGEATPPVESEIAIGYWEYPEIRLEAWKFADGYFLIQTNGTYVVPRGKNLLYDYKTKITSGFDLSKIKSKDSEIGGLKPPSNFPAKELISRGYKLNANGEYVKGDFVDPEPENPEPVGLKSIPNYPRPNSWNTEVFAEFPTIKLPKNIVSVGGYGFSLFKDAKINDKGKLNILNQGYSNLVNLTALERSRWAENKNGQWVGDAFYYFNQAYHLCKEASKQMRRNYNPEWGTLDPNDSNPSIQDYDISGLTKEGAIQMGRNMVGAANSIDDPQWNINVSASVLMIDEESITPRRWAGGDLSDFLGYVQKGISEGSKGNQKTFIYGMPISWWFHSRQARFNELTDAELLTAIDPANITKGEVWNGMRWYNDANGAYYRVPFLSNTNIYKKDAAGNFILKDGKRVYRDDNSYIDTYLSKNIPVLNQPDDQIKWMGFRPDGTDFWGWQKEWGSYDSRDMTFDPLFQGGGWKFRNGSRPYRPSWQGEYELFVNGVYNKADAVMQDLLLLSYKEKGKFDLFTPNQNYLMYVEHRPVTEPWTFGGNSTQVREIGDGMIYYDTFLAAYSGAKGLSTWDDGRYLSELPLNGNQLYWDDIKHTNPDGSEYYTRKYWQSDWTRYHARMSAIQEAFKDLQDTDAYSWKHIHFYQPYFGRKYKEVISSGIYYEGKLHVFFLNPSLENGEKQDLTLTIGGTAYNVSLDGHEFFYQTFNAPDGLNPKDFTLEYTTIYGKKTKVTGLVTDKLSDHYL